MRSNITHELGKFMLFLPFQPLPTKQLPVLLTIYMTDMWQLLDPDFPQYHDDILFQCVPLSSDGESEDNLSDSREKQKTTNQPSEEDKEKQLDKADQPQKQERGKKQKSQRQIREQKHRQQKKKKERGKR